MRIHPLLTVCLVWAGLSAGCASRSERRAAEPTNDSRVRQRATAPAAPMESPMGTILTCPRDLKSHVGQTVGLVGTLTRTKIPTVCGVDVDGDDHLSDKQVIATGVLERYVVPQRTGGPQVTSRGPGVYFRLVDETTGRLAKTRPYPPKR
jgi:hypothetical protein